MGWLDGWWRMKDELMMNGMDNGWMDVGWVVRFGVLNK